MKFQHMELLIVVTPCLLCGSVFRSSMWFCTHRWKWNSYLRFLFFLFWFWEANESRFIIKNEENNTPHWPMPGIGTIFQGFHQTIIVCLLRGLLGGLLDTSLEKSKLVVLSWTQLVSESNSQLFTNNWLQRSRITTLFWYSYTNILYYQ